MNPESTVTCNCNPNTFLMVYSLKIHVYMMWTIHCTWRWCMYIFKVGRGGKGWYSDWENYLLLWKAKVATQPKFRLDTLCNLLTLNFIVDFVTCEVKFEYWYPRLYSLCFITVHCEYCLAWGLFLVWYDCMTNEHFTENMNTDRISPPLWPTITHSWWTIHSRDMCTWYGLYIAHGSMMHVHRKVEIFQR